MQRKIKSRAELVQILGRRPRERKVILCAGVFDVVHPGHLRHLIYAKGKADVLVTAVTADRHVDKGRHRPHVGEGLRALNVAALEVVDFVMVDEDPTPVQSIQALQPDYFAKGYEYRAMTSPKTAEEAEVLASYGGEIIFTPGDVVYSSSKLLELPPSLTFDNLAHVMQTNGLTFGQLREIVAGMSGLSVHVLGDTIVDRITRTTVIGGQTKTPTISVSHEGEQNFAGGAAIVAKHLRAAGAQVRLSTVLGDDEPGMFVQNDLAAAGVRCEAIIDRTRPTTVKNAITAAGYRLLKVDTVDNRTISDRFVVQLELGLRAESDAVVFCDFRHGIFNRHTIPILAEAIRAPYRVVDSQVASRWGNINDFKGFDLITPNEREARFALGDQDSGIWTIAEAMREAAKCRTMMLKLGGRGLFACSETEAVVLDSFAGSVVDPVGAGDALLAYATLAMLASRNYVAAAVLGAVAAALECEADGNVPVQPGAVLERLARLEDLVGYGPRH